MGIKKPTYTFLRPFADDGTKTTIPDMPTVTGAANLSEGFPVITETPIAAGGIPPTRTDHNGILNALSQFIFWMQSGGQADWRADLDYDSPAIVFRNGNYYSCLKGSGPSFADGVRDPMSETSYWQIMSVAIQSATETVEGIQRKATDAEVLEGVSTVGTVNPKQLQDKLNGGGSGGDDLDYWAKYPAGIPHIWTGLLADIPLGYQLSDGTNGTVNMMGRYIKGISNGTTNPGNTGGANERTLTVAQMPQHRHGFTGTPHVHTGPSHNHGVGTLSTSNVGAHAHPIANRYSGDSTNKNVYFAYTGAGLSSAISALLGVTSQLNDTSTSSQSVVIPNVTQPGGAHNHTLSGNTAAAGTGNTSSTTTGGTIGDSGNGQQLNIEPAYVEVAWIIKLVQPVQSIQGAPDPLELTI